MNNVNSMLNNTGSYGRIILQRFTTHTNSSLLDINTAHKHRTPSGLITHMRNFSLPENWDYFEPPLDVH